VDGLVDAMRKLCDERVRWRMGRNARRFAEAHAIEEPFTAILDSAAYRARARAAKTEAEVELAPREHVQFELISTVVQQTEMRWEVALEA
jgi:hypothetical protein